MTRIARFLAAKTAGARRLALPVALLFTLALLVSACDTDTPQNTFDTKGPVADKQAELFYLAMWPALVIMILVEGLLVLMLLRFRRRAGDKLPKQTHGNTPLEIAWTIAPAVLLLIIGAIMLPAIFDLGRAPADDALKIKVIGQQWNWTFEYTDIKDADGNPLSTIPRPGTPTEFHIPVGREIGFTVTATDVIHSFWIPKLGGKLDAIPGAGHENVMWLRADEPGSYSGQCVELCGLDHALMKMVVVAESEEDFNAWVAEMQAGVAAGTSGADRDAPAAVAAEE